MKLRVVFLAGAGYGLLMRLAFGALPKLNAPGTSGAMLASFVVLVPLVIGMWTVYARRSDDPGIGFALAGPWAPTALFVAGTAVLLIEGSICIAMALPIFLALSSLGGLLAWIVFALIEVRSNALHALLLLPLLAGWAEQDWPLPEQIEVSRAAVHIAAPAATIWREINHAIAIAPDEMRSGWAYRIGVPYPIEAITHESGDGRVRKLRWQKDVSFDEPITAWEPERFIAWRYAFKPESFPPGTLDEHVLIGGRYFDLVDTSYRLTPEDGGTRVDIEVHYRVSTHFNWYAASVGRWLVGDAAQTILGFYKQRAEQPAR